MAGKAGVKRRSKKDVIIAKIEAVDAKISDMQKKIETLKEEKETFVAALNAIKEEEDKAAEEKKLKEVVSLIKKSGLSMDEVKEMFENKAPTKE